VYSQGSEESVILDYFGGRTGRFLDVGAYQGTIWSNTHALANCGWSGVAVEPDPNVFVGLKALYADRPDISLYQCALTNFNGQTEFHNSGGGGVSTLHAHHRAKWEAQSSYQTIYVDCMTPKELLRLCPGTFEFVSIDVEGGNADLLEMFPLSEMGVELLCVEHDNEGHRIMRYASDHGLNLMCYRSPENIILGR
jgi:FkbM family methyltransferase